jgi:hypothetical protein
MALKRGDCAGVGKDRGEVVRVWWAEKRGIWERSRVLGSKASGGGRRSSGSGGEA